MDLPLMELQSLCRAINNFSRCMMVFVLENNEFFRSSFYNCCKILMKTYEQNLRLATAMRKNIYPS